MLGVGSELHGDDAAGILVARQLRRLRGRNSLAGIGVSIGGTAPENVTGEIVRFVPRHILLIDAADLRRRPGAIVRVKPEAIGGLSCSTHSLSLTVLVSYLTESCGCPATVLGIQPASAAFGDPVSDAVRAAVRLVVSEIAAASRAGQSERTIPFPRQPGTPALYRCEPCTK